MTISAGSKLGPYEIVAPLGAGGMGEVWKALDPRIGREVAIKILHPAMSENEELVRRFEQEARTVGQLNHPNLIAVYDVGEEGEIAYLVTELLEGDTLRERLSGGALPMRRAIEWGSGIASGLAAAHEKGIVHRDLKPENIFVTKDNRVKILDFGLARLTNVGFSESGQTDAPTDQRTDPGKVMGTVGYMSPEQVRAMPVDHRSDIFSFGAILYEMLTGIRAFRRDSSIETMNAILKEEPPELTASNPNLHPGLERIVRHCLEKHPEARFQSAKDMAFDLESLSATSGSVPSFAAVASRRRLLLPVALAFVAIVLAAGGYWVGRSAGSGQPVATATNIPKVEGFERLTFRRGNVLHARFAPDGQSVVYSAAWDENPAEIFTVRLDDRISRPLGIERADVLSVSSKGELAVLLKDRLVLSTSGVGTLASVPLGGGTPRQILEFVFAACWSPDGESLAISRYDRASNRFIIEYPIGTEIRTSASFLVVKGISPDGSRIAFLEQERNGMAVRVASTSGEIDTVFVGNEYLGEVHWISNDQLIFPTGASVANELHIVGLDGADQIITELPGFEILDVSPRGDLVLEREIWRRELVYGSDRLEGERDLSWLNSGMSPLISANGRMVFTEIGESIERTGMMFMRDVEGSPPVMLGEGVATDVSRDGTLVVATRVDRPASLFVIPTGAGSPHEIKSEGASQIRGGRFVRQDRQVLLLATFDDGTRSFFLHDIASSATTRLTGGDDFGRGLAVSPDGEIVAYRRIDGKVVILGLDGGESTVVAGAGESDFPIQWSNDGKRLWVVDFQQSVPRPVWTIDLESGKRTLWKNLAPDNLTGVIRIDDPWIAPDGKSWAYVSILVTDSDLYTAKLTGRE